MAHKKGLGSSHNGRDPDAQCLDVERFGGQTVNVDEILVHQNGAHYHPGFNVGIGKDDTLFALKKSAVRFDRHHDRRIVSVKEAV